MILSRASLLITLTVAGLSTTGRVRQFVRLDGTAEVLENPFN
jgi:hypothetical protein